MARHLALIFFLPKPFGLLEALELVLFRSLPSLFSFLILKFILLISSACARNLQAPDDCLTTPFILRKADTTLDISEPMAVSSPVASAIALGAAVAGALITLVTFYLIGKNRKKSPQAPPQSPTVRQPLLTICLYLEESY